MIRNSAMATSQRVVGCAVIGAVVVLAVTIADWWAVRGAIHASRVGEPIGQWHTGIILILTTAILYGLVFCMLGRGGGDTAPAVTSGRRDINIFLGVVSTIFAWHYLEHGNVALVIGMLLVKLPFTVVVGRVGLWAVDQCRLVIKDFRDPSEHVYRMIVRNDWRMLTWSLLIGTVLVELLNAPAPAEPSDLWSIGFVVILGLLGVAITATGRWAVHRLYRLGNKPQPPLSDQHIDMRESEGEESTPHNDTIQRM